ncbi:hypothetical protein DICPUDRAFT_74076 [Dictyostelium purpureum]|uniref:Uncharacterized protein n=1 Tax=Dictyostelium purpureum TaxID=5786 RepID=F0Z6U5_DICPU|nr:uncharacterized protein DICPUDRAFT_74076 [Dictyostelium purpureum]EGC40371.1 hypothetical protein DICPUDRAFT_74076 [Dictyostelium purpureum]|eukprot:XP_003283122.1 hypothetical protein DICPUDRAFT_74076 [Dictyostelium purpureum]
MPNFDQVLHDGDLPNSITFLEFTRFNKKLSPNSIPSSVKRLWLGDFYDHPLCNLPQNLEVLELGFYFSCEIRENDIPPSVTKIIIYPDYPHPIPPPLLKIIEFFD